MKQRERVRVFEVGVRDGLQNEHRVIPLKDKIWFAQGLIEAGVRDLELGAFVREDRVPQMADTPALYAYMNRKPTQFRTAQTWCLVPNRKGLYRALEAKATRIAIFTGATESFVRKNIGFTIRESLKEFQEVVREGMSLTGGRLKVRGYVSTAFGCPFEGKVRPAQALRVIEKLAELGVEEVSVGDTIGVATPKGVDALIKPALRLLSSSKVAVHFHDTRGTALANALRSLEHGVRTIDSSAGGLGGCPFAPGAAGNLATEDLVYMLNGMGIYSGIDLKKLSRVSLKLAKKMKRPLTSRYLQAFAADSFSVF